MSNAIDIDHDDLVAQLYSALGAKDHMPLRDLVRSTGEVAVAELKVQLGEDAQSALTTLRGYCPRWDSPQASPPVTEIDVQPAYEPNPIIRFERERNDPDAYNPIIEFEKTWRRGTSKSSHSLPPLPAPPAWESKSVQELRGTLRGALKRLMPTEQEKPMKVRGVVAADIERLGAAHKHERVARVCRQGDVTELRSEWKDTADSLLRSTTSDDFRVDELWHLRSLTSALAAEAFRRKKARAALQKLDGILLTLMPREWFHQNGTREMVRIAVRDANVNVEELYLAFAMPSQGLHGENEPEQPPDLGADTDETQDETPLPTIESGPPASPSAGPNTPAGPAAERRLVTVKEAAAALGEPQKTIRNWINRKTNVLAPADRLGGPRSVAARYYLDDIEVRRPKAR